MILGADIIGPQYAAHCSQVREQQEERALIKQGTWQQGAGALAGMHASADEAPAQPDQAAAAIDQMQRARALWERMAKLEASLAYEYCCSVLDGSCKQLGEHPECCTPVYDLDDDSFTIDGEMDTIKEVEEYLDFRGLLGRSKDNPRHVIVLEESEATR